MHTPSFTDRQLIAELTAKALLEINAVHFRADQPYILASGLASPVYIDCRKLISYPCIRSALMDFATSIVLRDIGFEIFDSIAGGETAGIPFAAWIAERMSLPMQYVRKKPKGYGKDTQIEGHLEEGWQVLLVEDLTTDGGSKVRFCEALRNAGAIVNHALVIFYYDIFEEARYTLANHEISLHYLSTWRNVLAVCQQYDYFDTATLDQVETFLNDPLTWSGAHGGATTVSVSENSAS